MLVELVRSCHETHRFSTRRTRKSFSNLRDLGASVVDKPFESLALFEPVQKAEDENSDHGVGQRGDGDVGPAPLQALA